MVGRKLRCVKQNKAKGSKVEAARTGLQRRSGCEDGWRTDWTGEITDLNTIERYT
jgi:hypothetical protein